MKRDSLGKGSGDAGDGAGWERRPSLGAFAGGGTGQEIMWPSGPPRFRLLYFGWQWIVYLSQRRLLRVPQTARRSNQLILKEINSEYSLEGLLLKLQYLAT